ncbi:MAG: cupin domain-containing protein [Deltaproteobacteria bacterium]|uniref:Cupin domain-containing protein n=1 Tax=Candidatus Zymogenus saltonus TaxID=2844893 RepID=A0A9D8KF53_9DELT|nr:cupin domain-containing protein [Candidatus Zymogenus saltonus]
MFIKEVDKAKEITAGDGTRIREILSPKSDPVSTRYSLALAKIAPGGKSHTHKLQSSSEVYIILEGSGIMHIEEEVRAVRRGSVIYIPKGAFQFIENDGDGELMFYCIVDPPWDQGDEVVMV